MQVCEVRSWIWVLIRKRNSIIHLFIGLIGSRKKQDDKSSAGVEHAGEASSRQILPISGPLRFTFPFIVQLTQFSHCLFFWCGGRSVCGEASWSYSQCVFRFISLSLICFSFLHFCFLFLSTLCLLQSYAVDLNMSAILWMPSPSLARYFVLPFFYFLWFWCVGVMICLS